VALCQAVQLAHGLGRRVYVTVNILPREGELAGLPAFLEQLEDMGADGLIIADLGVLALANRYAPGVRKHVSTQFGAVNSAACAMLCDLGASRVVLARD
jgi:putative protease